MKVLATGAKAHVPMLFPAPALTPARASAPGGVVRDTTQPKPFLGGRRRPPGQPPQIGGTIFTVPRYGPRIAPSLVGVDRVNHFDRISLKLLTVLAIRGLVRQGPKRWW
jgi:hypothetical protein